MLMTLAEGLRIRQHEVGHRPHRRWTPNHRASTGPKAVQSWQPDVVVHVVGSFAAPIVAAVMRVPNVCVGFGSLVVPERMVDASDAVTSLWVENGLDPRPWGGCYDDLYVDIYPPSLRSGPSDHVPYQQSMRPVTFSTEVWSDGLDEDGVAELGAAEGRPVIYLTFGTVFNATGPFREAFLGLVDLDVRLVVTVGPQGDPKDFGALPSHVSVERYVPQRLLLPRCSLVVSHGGSGTFLGALDHALPQLAYPKQPINSPTRMLARPPVRA